jgi:hypothetical protein
MKNVKCFPAADRSATAVAGNSAPVGTLGSCSACAVFYDALPAFLPCRLLEGRLILTNCYPLRQGSGRRDAPPPGGRHGKGKARHAVPLVRALRRRAAGIYSACFSHDAARCSAVERARISAASSVEHSLRNVKHRALSRRFPCRFSRPRIATLRVTTFSSNPLKIRKPPSGGW